MNYRKLAFIIFFTAVVSGLLIIAWGQFFSIDAPAFDLNGSKRDKAAAHVERCIAQAVRGMPVEQSRQEIVDACVRSAVSIFCDQYVASFLDGRGAPERGCTVWDQGDSPVTMEAK